MAKYEAFFVQLMLTEELGHQLPESNCALIKNSLTMLLSFCIFGSLPLTAYILGIIYPELSSHQQLVRAGVIGMITLFALGVIKSKYSILTWYYSGVETMILGICCAAVAFAIGFEVNTLFNKEY